MIIGVTGAICSGTTTFMEYLAKKGFVALSYSDALRNEARRRGIEITRKNLQDLGDLLRKEKGNGVLSLLLVEMMEGGKNYVVGNIRNPGEVEVLRENFGDKFIFVLINASQERRFERLIERARENDPKTFEDFLKMEERDLGVGQEESGQQHGKVFEIADLEIENNNSLQSFYERIEKLIQDLDINI